MSSYIIITPVKNEVGTIEMTINSIVNQTVLPEQWIIVNDNSTDGTEIILEKLAKKYVWINVINLHNNEIRDYSCRVVHLFNHGYSLIQRKPEYVCKLDADVSFEKTFYENILSEFVKNPKLGIASGHLTLEGIPELIIQTPYVCTRGATKVYRVACLNEIGGIVLFQGWDSLDNVAARAKGWEAKVIACNFEHLKEEGSKVGNSYFKNLRTGYYNGILPYFFPYFIIKAFSKVIKKPFLIGTLLQCIGYAKGRLSRSHSPYSKYIINQLHLEQKNTIKFFFKRI